MEDARQWVDEFVRWYNEAHRHSGIRFVTPAQRHSGEEHSLLAKRKAVYEAARQRHPERWSQETRNREPVGAVWLNPDKSDMEELEISEKAA